MVHEERQRAVEEQEKHLPDAAQRRCPVAGDGPASRQGRPAVRLRGVAATRRAPRGGPGSGRRHDDVWPRWHSCGMFACASSHCRPVCAAGASDAGGSKKWSSGGRTGQKPGSKGPAPGPKADAPGPQWATRPVEVTTERVLGRVEKAPPPQWATFAGAASGVWTGSAYAANPFTGKLEPLGLDAQGKPSVTSVATRRLVARVAVSSGDGALHDTQWQHQAAAADGDAASPASWFVLSEGSLQAQSPGLAVFEDGSFSDGPLCLWDALDADSRGEQQGSPSFGVVTSHTCICVGGRERVVVTQTLQVKALVAEEEDGGGGGVLESQGEGANGEDDEEEEDEEEEGGEAALLVQQLRVRVCHEAWCGPQSGTAPAAASRTEAAESPSGESATSQQPPAATAAAAAVVTPPLAERPRAAATVLGNGPWTAFVRAASPALATAVASGPGSSAMDGDAAPRWGHEAYEQAVDLALPSGKPSARIEPESLVNPGIGASCIVTHGGSAALWLPGRVTAGFHLGTGPDGGGMTLSAGWVISSQDGDQAAVRGEEDDGRLVYCSIEREYDSGGDLVEVRHRTATRPGAMGRTPGGG